MNDNKHDRGSVAVKHIISISLLISICYFFFSADDSAYIISPIIALLGLFFAVIASYAFKDEK